MREHEQLSEEAEAVYNHNELKRTSWHCQLQVGHVGISNNFYLFEAIIWSNFFGVGR